MNEFITLLQIGDLSGVLIIIILAMVGIYKFIVWSKKTWAQRQEFQNANIAKGKAIQKQQDEMAEHERLDHARLAALESAVAKLAEATAKQQELIDLLIESDQLEIKAWIKEQHEKWMAIQAIDGQSLEVLEGRFAIYEKEGGNSWAHRLMEDIRALPLITVIPIAPRNNNE